METLLTTPPEQKSSLVVEFLNQIEGWKTKCKNLHWSASNHPLHVLLGDFGDLLADYQDGLAEGYMGIRGKLDSHILHGVPCHCITASAFISEVRIATITFYDSLPKETVYKGIVSECETFIQNINKYSYLFNLCNELEY